MNYTYLLLALSMLFACSSSKVQTNNSHSDVHSINVSDSMYTLRVSFFSIGSGIDGKAKQEYEQYINEFQTINNVTIVLDKTSWGKEGWRICRRMCW